MTAKRSIVPRRVLDRLRTQRCYGCGGRYHKRSPRCPDCRYPSQRENFKGLPG